MSSKGLNERAYEGGETPRQPSRLLIVEDKPPVARGVIRWLSDFASFDALDVATTAKEASMRIAKGGYDVALVDIGLGDGPTGLDLCREVRRAKVPIVLIVWTGHETLRERRLALSMGADDYLLKVVGVRELWARIRLEFEKKRRFAVENTPSGSSESQEFPLSFTGRKVRLSHAERAFLKQLVAHPIVPYAMIEKEILGRLDAGARGTAHQFVHRLCVKLGPAGEAIQVVRGQGYEMERAKMSEFVRVVGELGVLC